MGETTTTTTSTFKITGSSSTNWWYVPTGTDFTIHDDSPYDLKIQFQMLADKFFEKRGANLASLPEKHPERMINFYERMNIDEKLSALMS